MEASSKTLTRIAVALCVVVLLPAAAGADAPHATQAAAGRAPILAFAGLSLVATARLSREAALRDPVLKALKEAVEGARGGATAGEAAVLASARLGQELDRKSAEFHLSQLTRLRVLRRHKVGERRVYLGYDAPAPPPPEPLAARILALVQDCPGVSAAEAALRLGVTDTRFDRHLKALMQEGLVARWRPQGAPGFRLWPASATPGAPVAAPRA